MGEEGGAGTVAQGGLRVSRGKACGVWRTFRIARLSRGRTRATRSECGGAGAVGQRRRCVCVCELGQSAFFWFLLPLACSSRFCYPCRVFVINTPYSATAVCSRDRRPPLHMHSRVLQSTPLQSSQTACAHTAFRPATFSPPALDAHARPELRPSQSPTSPLVLGRLLAKRQAS